MNKKIAAIVFAIFVIVVFLCVGVTYCMPENEHTQETIIQETENNNETTMDSVQTDPTEDLSTNTEPPKVPETELEESVENNSPEENNPPKENKPLIETPKPTEPTSPSHIEETIPPQPETTPTEPEKNTESTEATVPNEPEKPVEKPKPQEKDSSYYTLRRNFGFYNGTMSMSNITKIIFSK